MFTSGRGKGAVASIAVAAVCAVGALWVGAAGAAVPGVDPGYAEGGILRTESQLPAGYTEGQGGVRVLPGTNGSALYISELMTCGTRFEAACRIPAVVRRFTPSGSLDGTYGEGGLLKLGFQHPGGYPVAVSDARGRLFVAEGGETVSVRRFTARGKGDSGYGGFGAVSLGGFGKGASVAAVLTAPHERLVVAVAEATENEYTRRAERVTLIRLLPDGRVDRSFGKRGRAVLGITSAFGVRIFETSQGATLVVAHNCCSASDFTPVYRVSAAGKVDVHFNAQERRSQVKALAGLAEPDVASVVPRADGVIELFGTSRSAGDPGGPSYVLRLEADGRIDSQFGKGGVVTLGPNLVDAEAGSGGSSLLSFRSYAPEAEARAHFERLLSDGRPDPRFGGEAGIEVPAPGGEATLFPSAGSEALAFVGGTKNCQVRCEGAPYLMRLIEPSAGKSGTGKGGKR